jgi:hypothetical protein
VRFVATCDNCSRLIIGEGIGVSVPAWNGARESFESAHVREAAASAASISWLPLAAHSPTIEDVPPSIEYAAKEAYSGWVIGNHMSAILMARTVIEATAKAKNIKSGALAVKIDLLRDGQFIRPAIAEQAHQIRFFGNEMAHGDIDDIPTTEDAEEILALMAEVLAEVFQGPARLQRLQKRRETR